jgi:hypothetical protein
MTLRRSSVIYHHSTYIHTSFKQREEEGGGHVWGGGVESAIRCGG